VKVQTLQLNADAAALEKLGPFIEALGVSRDRTFKTRLRLAIHELCINIIQHAYAGANGTIAIEAVYESCTLTITVTDSAPNAYAPPREIALPDPFSLPEGGWGIYIIHQIMDEVRYERLESGNRWHLIKNMEETA
jgi:serine/threonine-protein kinase RsbW